MKITRILKTPLKQIVLLLLPVLCFFSCGTLPTEENVSKDLTPIEIKQLAQEEIDKGSRKNALAYYEILLNRYGSDLGIRTAAEFEIAHIYISQKKWAIADDMLKTIITRYESIGGAELPPKYFVLAKNDYAKTQKHLAKKDKSKKAKEEN